MTFRKIAAELCGLDAPGENNKDVRLWYMLMILSKNISYQPISINIILKWN